MPYFVFLTLSAAKRQSKAQDGFATFFASWAKWRWTTPGLVAAAVSNSLDFACEAPDSWLALNESDRAVRGKLGDDLCKIDDDLFVRGCLEIPILGQNEKFIWGVWVSVSQQSFDRVIELWNAPSIEGEPPRFGWLCNNIRTYPATYGLKTRLHLRSGDKRPFIELEPTDHPLAIEQRNGISLRRVEGIATALLPRH